MAETLLATIEQITGKIHFIRGAKVIGKRLSRKKTENWPPPKKQQKLENTQ